MSKRIETMSYDELVLARDVAQKTYEAARLRLARIHERMAEYERSALERKVVESPKRPEIRWSSS